MQLEVYQELTACDFQMRVIEKFKWRWTLCWFTIAALKMTTKLLKTALNEPLQPLTVTFVISQCLWVRSLGTAELSPLAQGLS